MELLNCPEVIKELVFSDKTQDESLAGTQYVFLGSASFSAIAVRELRGNRRSQGVWESQPRLNLREIVFHSLLNKVSYLTREVLIHKFWLRDDFFLTGQTTP